MLCLVGRHCDEHRKLATAILVYRCLADIHLPSFKKPGLIKDHTSARRRLSETFVRPIVVAHAAHCHWAFGPNDQMPRLAQRPRQQYRFPRCLDPVREYNPRDTSDTRATSMVLSMRILLEAAELVAVSYIAIPVHCSAASSDCRPPHEVSHLLLSLQPQRPLTLPHRFDRTACLFFTLVKIRSR